MSRLPTQPFQTCCCNDGQNRSSARKKMERPTSGTFRCTPFKVRKVQ